MCIDSVGMIAVNGPAGPPDGSVGWKRTPLIAQLPPLKVNLSEEAAAASTSSFCIDRAVPVCLWTLVQSTVSSYSKRLPCGLPYLFCFLFFSMSWKFCVSLKSFLCFEIVPIPFCLESALIETLVCPKSLCLEEWSLYGAGDCPAVSITFPEPGSICLAPHECLVCLDILPHCGTVCLLSVQQVLADQASWH